MKTIMRIAIILVASLLVVGVTSYVGNNSTSGENFPPNFEQRDGEGADIDTANGTTNFRERRPSGDFNSGGFNIRGVLGFAQTLIPMTIVIFVVSMVGRFSKRRNHPPKVAARAG